MFFKKKSLVSYNYSIKEVNGIGSCSFYHRSKFLNIYDPKVVNYIVSNIAQINKGVKPQEIKFVILTVSRIG